MAETLTWLEPDDETPLAALSFPATVPGTPSASVEVHLRNDSGVTVTTAKLRILVRPQGETDFVGAGAAPVDQGWVELRRIGASGAREVRDGWAGYGGFRYLALQPLPAGAVVGLEVRLNPPLDAETSALDVLIQRDFTLSAALPTGTSALAPDGVLSGIGEPDYSGLFVGAPVTESDPVGASVEVPYTAGVQAGVPFGIAATQVSLSSADGAAATLGAGEAYWALIAVNGSGSLAVTKGAKAASGSAAKPAIPAGHLPRAFVLREFDGLVNSGDIEQETSLERYQLRTSGLLAYLGPGRAKVADHLLPQAAAEEQLSLEATSTNWLWKLAAGTSAVTQTADPPPTGGALLIWEVDTDGSSVVAVRDRRLFIGTEPVRMPLRISGVTEDAAVLDVVDAARPLLLDPERPLVLAVDDTGTGTGATVADVEYSEDGGSWTSIFPGADSMPAIAGGAAQPVKSAGRPTTCVIPPAARVRFRVEAVPGTTVPGEATLVLLGGYR